VKKRLDTLLTEGGLFPSREQAARAVRAGWIKVDGRPADKPGKPFPRDCSIEVLARPRYVGRGGDKLSGALSDFGIEVKGKTAIDAGASTGGFTDCLLQSGAAKVFAFDVGRGQLAWTLRTDPRVELREKFNVRYLRPEDVGEQVDLAVADLSFISLKKILPALIPAVKGGGEILALIKPQFEAPPCRVGKGGVVRDPEVHREVIDDIIRFITGLGHKIAGVKESRLTGPAGNREFFIRVVVAGEDRDRG